MPVSSWPNPTRLLFLDIFRVAAFGAIVIFHLSYAFWGRFGISGVPVPGIRILEIYARILAFAGFAVMFISFFLYGWLGRVGIRWWVPAVFFGLWCLLVGGRRYTWDIYPFLMVAFATVEGARRARAPAAALAFFGGILLSVPFWKLEGQVRLPGEVQAALWGYCSGDLRLGDWPLLPFLGLPLFAFGIGRMSRDGTSRGFGGRMEALTWAGALAASLPWLGQYYVTPLGDGFACYVFRRPANEFWAHLVWVGFVVRLSFLAQVQGWLERSSAALWISRRSVNRHFFLCYFLHYPLCFAASWSVARINPGLIYEAWPFWLSFAGVAALTEAVTVVFPPIFRKDQKGGQHA